MKYKLGSLFDGSGGFPLAGSLCGIEPVWAAEVEPYPIAVTRSRFPSMKHLGDISKINGAEIEPVDIVTFGSPCQDLSVAGKRAGLKHEANGDEETTRSGLFMEAVRIIKEMRRATNGNYPTFALWENVPGAFSSNKGEDFRIVCEELIKIVEPSASMPPVPKNGWPYADSYRGDGWSLAYRVFDAQYWGVPQRRRRIHLVLDLRGERAREVLFEREGVRGYFAEGRTPWQAAAGDAPGGAGADDRAGEGFDGYNGDLTGDVSATLGVNCGVSTGRNGIIEYGGRGLDAVGLTNRGFCSGDKAETLRAESHGALPMVCEAVPYTLEPGIAAREGGHVYEGVSGTLRADAGDNRMAVAYSFDSLASNSMKSSNPHSGCRQVDVSYTLNTIDRPAVAFQTYQKVTGLLMANSHPGSYTGQDAFSDMLVAGVDSSQVFRQGGFADYVEGEVGTLRAAGGDYGGGTENLLVERPAVRYIVRRLTPTECARLQGFADRWGDIDEKDTFTEEEYRFWLDVRNTHATVIGGKEAKEYTKAQMLTWYNKLHTDSAEYKMWGNGIALPPALYCMQGMVEAMEKEAAE